MISADTYQHVADIIKHVADTEILARFHTLTDNDITEKHPGDLVTTADTNAEQALTEHLEKLIPGSVTVGEEATETDPALLNHLTTDTPTWIIDPVDGTSNFVHRDPHYSCLVALASAGTTHASWLYAPSLPLTAGGHTGRGAWINQQPATITTPTGPTLNIVTTHPHYLAGYDWLLPKLTHPHTRLTPCSSAGLSYIELIQGQHQALVYTWEKPWDHATGLHIHALAGGTNTTMDGTSFHLAGHNQLPLIAADPTTTNTITHWLHT